MKVLVNALFVILLVPCCVAAADEAASKTARPLIGVWALTLPGGAAGWLDIHEESGAPVADLMYAVGHPERVKDAVFENGGVRFTAKEPGKEHKVSIRPGGGGLQGQVETTVAGKTSTGELTGQRQPPLPPRPNLEKVRFGEPITLFNGRDLTGWRPNEPERPNGWAVREGLLSNITPRNNQGGHGDHANLRTDREFEDFKLHIEYRLPAGGGNSGIYLRGLYEVQVSGPSNQPPNNRGTGSVYGRITPTENAAKAFGEWQTYDLTLVDRHVTVVLNGKKVIDNEPVIGCTGGALSSDVMKPGPVYLQGDHTTVDYRNIVLTPVVR